MSVARPLLDGSSIKGLFNLQVPIKCHQADSSITSWVENQQERVVTQQARVLLPSSLHPELGNTTILPVLAVTEFSFIFQVLRKE